MKPIEQRAGELERVHLLLLEQAKKGLEDVLAGRVKDARSELMKLKRRLKKS